MVDACFKFQSDSINTEEAQTILMYTKDFKFQSDSINTKIMYIDDNGYSTLNSNLILLILCSKQL